MLDRVRTPAEAEEALAGASLPRGAEGDHVARVVTFGIADPDRRLDDAARHRSDANEEPPRAGIVRLDDEVRGSASGGLREPLHTGRMAPTVRTAKADRARDVGIRGRSVREDHSGGIDEGQAERVELDASVKRVGRDGCRAVRRFGE